MAGGRLRVMAPRAHAAIVVLDHHAITVATGIGSLDVALKAGIYRVKVSLPGGSAERLSLVVEGEVTLVDVADVPFDSAAPIPGARSTDARQAVAASFISRHTRTGPGQGDGRLFLFVRTAGGEPREAAPDLTLRSARGEPIARLADSAELSLNEGWCGMTLDLPAGTYVLETTMTQLGRRAQAVLVQSGWETQVFVPWSQTPDLARAGIYLRRRGSGFDPEEQDDYERVDAALDRLGRGGRLLDDDERAIRDARVENPMLALIFCYEHLRAGEQGEHLVEAVARVRQLLPTSPDAELLGVAVGADLGRVEFRDPPMLAAGNEILMARAARDEGLVPARSKLGGIAPRLTAGSPWTRWNAGVSEDEALAELREDVRAARDDRKVRSPAELAPQLALPLSVVARAWEGPGGNEEEDEPPSPPSPPSPPPPPPPPPWWGGKLLWLTVLPLVVVAAVAAAVFLRGGGQLTVPDLTGLTAAAARAQLESAGLALGATSVDAGSTATPGTVVGQDPIPGASVDRGAGVSITLAPPARPVSVPDLTGLTAAAARTRLERAGLALGGTSVDAGSTAIPGTVVGQDPAPGASVDRGAGVNITLAPPARPVSVPDLTGLTAAAARTELEHAGLVLGGTSVDAQSTATPGTVVGQDPIPGASVDRGAGVSVTLAPSVSVPDLTGLKADAARKQLESDGLAFGATSVDAASTAIPETVVGQDPAPGASVDPGSSVSITLAPPARSVSVPDLTGLTADAARKQLEGDGLALGATSFDNNSTATPETVVGQDPAPGASVDPGSSVSITVARTQG